jgi:hypothetical protein
VIERKRISWRRVLWQRGVPGDDLRCADEVQPGSRQRVQVQRLANVASRIGPVGMLVEERAARRKKEQRGACENRQRAAYSGSPENGFLRLHLSTLYCSTLDGGLTRLVAGSVTGEGNGLLDAPTFLA